MTRLAHLTMPLTLLCALLILTPLQSQANASYAELYKQAGLDRQLALLSEQISSEYEGLPKRVSSRHVQQSVHLYIDRYFSEEALRKTILEHWAEQLDSDDLLNISGWLGSATGSKLTHAEISATLGEGTISISSYLQGLRQKPPTKMRIDLLRLLDRAVHSSDGSTDMGILINLAAITALHASGLAPESAKTPTEQAKTHEKNRGLIRAMIRQDVLKYNLYCYREFDDISIRSYIAFAESPAGAKYHKSTFFATRAALAKATLELQRQLIGQRQQASTTRH